jgi:glycosyltransferase involved in cell wall biosynthesis
VFLRARDRVPLDLVGTRSEDLGGRGEIPPPDLACALAPYRFYFHPVRYTSLGLSLCEAMTVGLPVVGLATTELPTIIEDGVNGFAATDPDRLIESMRALLADPGLARRIGAAGRVTAATRFSIHRFVRNWDRLLRDACGRTGLVRPGPGPDTGAASGDEAVLTPPGPG